MNRFCIRPKPQSGEALSSYLLRVCNRNLVQINGLFREVSNTGIAPQSPHLKPLIDVYPEKVISLEKLSQITGITERNLKQMTISSAIKKMGIGLSGDRLGMRRGIIVPRTRRFCRVCLKINPVYKIKWQISNLEICDEHLVKLETACHECGKSQSYWNETTALMLCRHCGSSLAGDAKIVDDKDFIQHQCFLYDQWEFLLKDDCTIVDVPDDMKNRAIATKLLYVLQNYESTFSRSSILSIRKDRLYWLVRFIHGETREHYLTIGLLLDSLYKIKLRLEEFSNIVVPEKYALSILEDKAKSYDPGSCLAPWCKAFGSNHDMKPMSHLTRFIDKDEKFGSPHVCTSCFVKYGYSNKANLWCEVGDLITIGWNKIVPLIKKDTSVLHISKLCGIRKDKVLRIQGYFYGRDLVPGVEEIPLLTQDILVKFKNAYSHPNCERYAKITYGWSSLVYWSIYGSNLIQNYIIFHHRKKFDKHRLTVEFWKTKVKNELKNRLENGLPITLNEIGSAVGCSAMLIQKLGLNSLLQEVKDIRNQTWIEQCHILADEYIGNGDNIDADISVSEFCKLTQRGKWSVYKYMPEILQRIDEEAKRRIRQRRFRMVEGAIEQLKKSNRQVTIEAVVRILGIGSHTVFKDKELKDLIYNAANLE